MAERNPQLEAARRRRLLAQLDRALARQGVKPPPRRPATHQFVIPVIGASGGVMP